MSSSSVTPSGPGAPFQPLIDEDTSQGSSLPEPFQNIYGSDWRLPEPEADRPYTYVNFVVSRDGRVSFDEPGHIGGGDVSRFNRHDTWLMGVLRARADAILVGDNTLKLEPEHIWTAEHIFPDDAAALNALRASEGRRPIPLHVFLSFNGDIATDAEVFSRPDIEVLVATTTAGAATASRKLRHRPNDRAVAFGDDSVDLRQLAAYLRNERGVRSLLCEGGARVYGSMLAAEQIDDEFLTLSPIVIGNRSPDAGKPRPSLVEGVVFGPDNPPTQALLSVRRSGDHLFLRSRYMRQA